ncbi:MAG: cysteine hydrolase family protein, partial [Candidatus Fimadaptatus sp.]
NTRILEAQAEGQEIIYIKNTKRLRGGAFTDELAQGLLVVTDSVFCKERADAFSSGALLAYLRSKGVTEVELMGVDGNSCISASARGAMRQGFAVVIDPGCVGAANALRFEVTKDMLSSMGVVLKQG